MVIILIVMFGNENPQATVSFNSLASARLSKLLQGHAESDSFLIGTEPILLVAIEFNLLLYGLRSLKEDILATTDKNLIIFSIDYDLMDQKVFWTDLTGESITWMSMGTKKTGTVVKGMPFYKAFLLLSLNIYSINNKMGDC